MIGKMHFMHASTCLALVFASILAGSAIAEDQGAKATATKSGSEELIVVRSAYPQYPVQAAGQRIEGYATVEFFIEADGTVSSAEVIDAQPAIVFNEAAIEAALKWKFEELGAPRTATQTFTFNLR